MNITIKGPFFLYGNPSNKPPLPSGWRYIEREGEWLLAESPLGRQYYVSAKSPTSPALLTRCKTANLWDVIRTLPNYLRGSHAFRIGQQFVDEKDVIAL